MRASSLPIWRLKPTISVNMMAASLRLSATVFGRPSDMAAIILLPPPGCQMAGGLRKFAAYRRTQSAPLNPYGLSLAELQQRHFLDFLAGENREEIVQSFAGLRQGQPVRGLEVRA